MNSIQWDGCVPVAWRVDQLPHVDDVRPHRCPRCLTPAKLGTRVVLHGHGSRVRGVVVTPALETAPVLEDCWVRRYRCTACRSVATVLPIGVLPRFLYSALAIVVAFVLVAGRPLGDGLSDDEAYDRQGMNRVRGWTKPWPYRWRSLDRWQARIGAWWPGLPEDLDGLLAGLWRRAGTLERRALLQAATTSHVRWGPAM